MVKKDGVLGVAAECSELNPPPMPPAGKRENRAAYVNRFQVQDLLFAL